MDNIIIDNSDPKVEEISKEISKPQKNKTKKLKVHKCKVVNYNKYSGVVVFECNGKLIQSNAIDYDGTSEFVKWEY